MNAFLGFVASNAIVATLLALVAALAGRAWKNPAAIHLLWVVVLLKLFTPPILTVGLPFGTDRRGPDPVAIADGRASLPDNPGAGRQHGSDPVPDPDHRAETLRGEPATALVPPSWSFTATIVATWIAGSCGTALLFALRIKRFAGDIRDLEEAPADIVAAAARLSERLGLRRVPEVRMTSRVLPPLVWSMGRAPRVILPSSLFARLDGEGRCTILAHELAHIRRGDHLVRFLELAAAIVFWWHPVVRPAIRQLREHEERCCDGRVLELLPGPPRTYAAALVDALEFLSGRPRNPAPLHTPIDPFGSLSTRIRMLNQRRPSRLGIAGAALVVALVGLPLAIAFGRQAPNDQAAPGSAVLRGRVADEAGRPLADARVRVAVPAADMRFVHPGSNHRMVEGRTDAEGQYRLELPGISGRTTVSLDAMKPGFRRLVGTLMSGGDEKSVDVTPGGEAEASLTLKPALYFAGVVVDERGNPIPGVEIFASASDPKGTGGVEVTASNPDGTFELFNYAETPAVIDQGPSKGRVQFFHPRFVGDQIDDVYATPKDRREGLRVVLKTGRSLAGIVRDAGGEPVAGAMVRAMAPDGSGRKGTRTDAAGQFALHGLIGGETDLTVRALAIHQTWRETIDLDADRSGIEVRLRPMDLPADLKVYDVLGMKLADVTPALKSAYDLTFNQGALILDPGRDHGRLEIGELAEGFSFWMVGQKRIRDVGDFVDGILQEAAGQASEPRTVRIVYFFSTPEMEGTNTQHLRLTAEDLKQLRSVSEALKARPR